jgi:hypothetical protein
VPSCFMFDRQAICRAFSRALAKTGKRIAASIAIIAITTSNSISVKPARADGRRLARGSLESPPAGTRRSGSYAARVGRCVRRILDSLHWKPGLLVLVGTARRLQPVAQCTMGFGRFLTFQIGVFSSKPSINQWNRLTSRGRAEYLTVTARGGKGTVLTRVRPSAPIRPGHRHACRNDSASGGRVDG